MDYDVVVIGGGVTGTAIVRELSRFDLRIALLEQYPDIAMGSTKANSAIVHGGFAEAHSKLKGRLCYQGRRRFKELSDELGFSFKAIGSFVLAFEEEQLPKLESILENGRQNGLTDLSILRRDEIIAREPNINPEVKYGLWCEGAGVCSPYEYAIVLAENAVLNGVKLFLNTEVSAIEKADDGSIVTAVDGRTFSSRFVVNAAGTGAGSVSALAGVDDFSVKPRSGEYLIMSRGTGILVNSVLFQMPTRMGKGILVTPTVYGNLLIGPDAIDEEKDDRDTHVERLFHIYHEALLTTKKLEIKKFLRSFAGVRAVSSTDDFVIGATGTKGFVNVAGIQSPGMTSSPAVADLVRDILRDEGLKLNARRDFIVSRKPLYTEQEFLPAAEATPLVNRALGEDGRLVCRCEQVPEVVVRDSMRRPVPATTADGIKRRARAGMGFCQGQFCRPRVAEVAADLGIANFDARTDVERAGLKRAGREEVLAYFKERGIS